MTSPPTRRAILGTVAGCLPAVAGCQTGGDSATAPSATLLARDGAPGDAFGWAVALADGTALVGAPQAAGSGAAYVFEPADAGWTQQAVLSPSDGTAGAGVGRAVALDDGRALVGAPDAERGAVDVFDRRDGDWRRRATLTPPTGQSRTEFGWAVALDGDRALVGARSTDGAAGPDVGAAHVFERTGSGWSHRATLRPNDGARYDYFGGSVALDGGRALIGSFLADARGSDSGAAYVFERGDGGWQQRAKLTAGDDSDRLGNAVALAGATAVVGAVDDATGRPTATRQPGGAGSTVVFERADGGWNRTTRLTAPDGEGGDNFGIAVAAAPDRLLVGAFGDDTGATDAGTAYTFGRTDGTWRRQRRLTTREAEPGAAFGSAVALDGRRALVGAVGADLGGHDAGAAYVVDL